METKYSKYLCRGHWDQCDGIATGSGDTHAFRVDIMTTDPIVLSCQVVLVKSGSIHSTSVLSTT